MNGGIGSRNIDGVNGRPGRRRLDRHAGPRRFRLTLGQPRTDQETGTRHTTIDGEPDQEAQKSDSQQEHREYRHRACVSTEHTLSEQHSRADPRRESAVPGEFT
jgi:hypothetical protein